jgi:metal-dependent hydrolase (beta-lactamase superfamily II)
LEDKGVNPNKIKLIICTHWHDDHIAGMGKLLDTYSDAIFSFARATDLKKFLNFVSLDYQKLNTSASNASTKEFNNCLDILRKSQRTAKLAEVDKLLYSANEDNGSFEVWALSSR